MPVFYEKDVVIILNKFVTKFDKEFLSIGYVCISDYLFQRCGGKDKIELVNEDGVRKVFRINHAEKFIEGVGIKSFFNKYPSPYLELEQLGENEFKIKTLDEKLISNTRTSTDFALNPIEKNIISKMVTYSTTDEKWFSLYEYSKLFINASSSESLQCLQNLSEIQQYQYQIKTVEKIFSRFKGRVLLCDEVGLGKTIEACMAMVEYIIRGLAKKILILTPASLVDQWYIETKTLFNQDFIRADDPIFKKGKQKSWGEYSKVIASIAAAKRKVNADAILEQQYDLIIVDEAHHLKNTSSVAWQFVNSLKKKYIFLLTATPVQNSLEELYNLITLLKPGQLRTYNYFKKNFVGDKEGLVLKNPNKLRELLDDVMIRNKRSDVDIKFTKRFAHTYRLDLSRNEQMLYADLSQFIREKYLQENHVWTKFTLKNLQERMGSSFQTLLSSLENLVNSDNVPVEDKLVLESYIEKTQEILFNDKGNEKLLKMLAIIEAADGKVLIFTKYKKTLEIIVSFLKERNIITAHFHGSMLKKDKEKQIQHFKDNATVLVSTEAGGEGRNLQFCNCMINFDLPWNPMAIEQRIGRIHRIGQERDVFVYNLAFIGTIEYYILELLDKKINMFELAIGEVDMILGEIEDKNDFADIIMDAWVKSEDIHALESEIDKIGEKLIQNKMHFERIKDIDNKIFSDITLLSKEGGSI